MSTKRLLIAPHDPAEFLGGTERVAGAMARAYVRRGEEVILFTGSERREGGGLAESRGEPGLAVLRQVRAESETAEHTLRPRIRAAFDRLVETVRPNVVHRHHASTLSLDLMRAASSRGVPVVAFLHDLWLSCPRYFRIPPAGIRCPAGADRTACVRCVGRDLPWEDAALRDWMIAFTSNAEAELKAARLRVAPSHAHARALQSFFPGLALDVRVVPHGLLEPVGPARSSAPAPSQPAHAESGVLHLVSFGNLVPEKGLEDLAAALGTLREPHRVMLDLYGAEVARDFGARLRALAPKTPISLHGPYESFAAIAPEVSRADLAVFPSRCHESYGLVVDEALAAGVPALVSDGGGLPERVGRAGEVVAMRDVDAWRAAIERLLADPTRLRSLRAAIAPSPRTIDDAIAEIDALEAPLLARA